MMGLKRRAEPDGCLVTETKKLKYSKRGSVPERKHSLFIFLTDYW